MTSSVSKLKQHGASLLFFKSRSIESPGHYDSESKLLIIFSEGETQSLKSSHKGGGGGVGGWELFGHFFSRLSFLFSLSVFGGRPDMV